MRFPAPLACVAHAAGLLDVFAQADRAGAVAGQRSGPGPAARRLIRHGRLGVGGHLAGKGAWKVEHLVRRPFFGV